jgi:D-sedoheptulose 7-phosphate isomerase
MLADKEVDVALNNYLNSAKKTIESLVTNKALRTNLKNSVDLCVGSLKLGGKIMLMGNGGSAADAQHIAGELVSRFMFDRPGLSSIALTTDTSILTAVGNDYGYKEVFARQVSALGRKGDILIGYSTSGTSSNILAGFDAAKKIGVSCIGFTGMKAGKMEDLCDEILKVPSVSTPHIQECHIILGHALCAMIECIMFDEGN